MTNGVGWACRLETGVATMREAVMKELEEMEAVVNSTVEEVAEVAAGFCRGRVGKKSMRDSESIRNLFE